MLDFIDVEKVFLSDIDSSALLECKKDFNLKNCFLYDYQNTIVKEYDNMPPKLISLINENPANLFIVCNPPHLQLQGTNPGSFYVPKTIIANEYRDYGVMAVADTYRQFMI